MVTFCWIADGWSPPPFRWDLRRRGWSLCCATPSERPHCAEVHLLDAREASGAPLAGLSDPSLWPAGLILIGIDDGEERARLLERGFADALPRTIGLNELAARARRVVDMAGLLPRCRSVGPLTLDLFHRDARLGAGWLNLHPREFGLLWRLADHPGRRFTRRELLRDVWRIHHEPETNSLEVHVSRLRSKLAGVGCEALVQTVSEGGYRLEAPPGFQAALPCTAAPVTRSVPAALSHAPPLRSSIGIRADEP